MIIFVGENSEDFGFNIIRKVNTRGQGTDCFHCVENFLKIIDIVVSDMFSVGSGVRSDANRFSFSLVIGKFLVEFLCDERHNGGD
jgi:hypothetical protein